jgi:hypothetical protein
MDIEFPGNRKGLLFMDGQDYPFQGNFMSASNWL